VTVIAQGFDPPDDGSFIGWMGRER